MRTVGHRVATRVATAAVIPLVVIALAGCDALNSASETVDKAKICTDALGVAGFTPDTSNPQKSVEEAQSKAEELRKLADQAADANLQQELREMADSLGNLKVSDLNPANAITWTDQKVKQLEQLRKVCS